MANKIKQAIRERKNKLQNNLDTQKTVLESTNTNIDEIKKAIDSCNYLLNLADIMNLNINDILPEGASND
jgi:hypothetical protein